MVRGYVGERERNFVFSMAKDSDDIMQAIHCEAIAMWRNIARRQTRSRYNADITETKWHDRWEQVAQMIIQNRHVGDESYIPDDTFDILEQVVDYVAELHRFYHHDPAKWIEDYHR